LVQTNLRHAIANVDEALAYLVKAERINTSKRIDEYGEPVRLGEKLQKRLQDREWLLHELFNY
jgi:hypothetical protein